METHDRIRVAIVEDHALTRAGLRTALEASFDVVAEAADGLSGWEAIRREHPDVAVIDIGIPVIAYSHASFFAAFKSLGMRDEINGHGRLLASLARLAA